MISVLTPAHISDQDAFGFLIKCLRSVEEADHIVVDDGSPYLSAASLAEMFPKAFFLRFETCRGPGFARNVAARVATSHYLFGLDADDLLFEHALDALYEARSSCAFVYGDFVRGGERKRLPDYSYDILRRMTGPIGVSALQPRWMWSAVGGWNEHLEGLEDIDYWIKLAELGICGRRIEAVIFHYRERAGSRTAKIYADGILDIRESIRRRHAPFMGGKEMPCVNCPQEGAANTNSTTPVKPGEVALKYVGPRLASFFTSYSPITKQRYRVEGKGQWVNVAEADVPWLLSMSGPYGREYMLPQQEEPVAPAYAIRDLPPPPPPLPRISLMSLNDALNAVANADAGLSLDIMEAMERARPKPREAVLNAITARRSV